MCKYCDIQTGWKAKDELETISNYEEHTAAVLSDWYDEGVMLEVAVDIGGCYGFDVLVEIPVKYCPNCGRRLYGTNQPREEE